VNQYDVPKLFASAYLRVAIPQNAISGFQSSGIWPYDPNAFSDADYAPSSVTDHPYPDFNRVSPADLPDPEIFQSYADIVSLSKTETPFSNDSVTQCEHLNRGYSPVIVNMIFALVRLLSNVFIVDGRGNVSAMKS
jgi:hypothetical protein